MLFQYVGDGDNSPQTTEVFGHTFELKGEPVDVKNPAAIKKLKGNKTFIHEPIESDSGDAGAGENSTGAGEVKELTYHEKISFIASKGEAVRSRKGADVDAQYAELAAVE